MADEEYRPRATDHLVEPMFAGLGVGDGEEQALEAPAVPPAEDRPARGLLAALARVARRLLGRGRRPPDPGRSISGSSTASPAKR
ncbi:MAG: hypothetical protein AB1726_05850 [Planctomycetota bacterium]